MLDMQYQVACRVIAIFELGLIARGTSTCLETKYLVSGKRPIPDDYLTASSEFDFNRTFDNYSPGRSRLDTKEIYENKSWLNGCWAARTNDAQQWIQARFLERSYITGIVTQGRNVERGHYQRVTSYQFHFSEDCVNFLTFTKPNGDNEIFPGNTDQDSHVTNMLSSPVRALCVRIQPVTWVGYISLRFDVLGCSCGNHYGFRCEQCPANCASMNNGTSCDDQGVCVEGCSRDFFGRQCNNPCPSNCAAESNGSRCDQHGDCVNGCVNDHFGGQCSNPCPTNCAPVAGENRCSNPGTCTMGCIAGYKGGKCESSIERFVSEESGIGFKSGMIASLIVNFVAIIIIAMICCLLRKKRLTNTDVVNKSMSDRPGHAELNQFSPETLPVYSNLDNKRDEEKPYAALNFGHALSQ
ncbi:uncharacterized protein LOC127864839 [Dreissena polymorpha]|uniref:uncharacterized protein LOC127864839 n=1 Tax=Dreissena polymorpha TaxID=45954 RepID=UPI0022644B5B|nr:uncharacterized protein LOC127864839 [Dreissena polymorpha]